LEAITKIASLAIRKGIILERWLNVTNVMIEKVPGKPLLNKLRVIHLFEADFNLCLRILWGMRLMRQAERRKALGEQQFGSRKGKSSEEVVLYKALTYELWNLTRTDGGTFDNDAKACYDRVIPNMTSICAQRLGMKTINAKLHALILKGAKYKLKTTLGTSEEFYKNTEEKPLYGLGQGSTAAAFAWAVISAVILKIMSLLRGVRFCSPTRTFKVQRVMDAFVDDSTSWVNCFVKSLTQRHTNHIGQVAQDLRETAQKWETLLHSTGGALELSKCFYYLVQWKFDKRGNPSIAPPDPDIPPIELVSSANGDTVKIKQLDCSEPHKTLGVLISPSRNYTAERKRLADKAREFGQQAAAASIYPRQARRAYQGIYVGRMRYGLLASTMKQEDYQTIQSPATQAILPKLGFNRNMPKEVVYGPTELGGVGLQDLYVMQGTRKVITIVEHVRCKTNLGLMILATIQWTQHSLGVGFDILRDPARRIPPSFGDSWIRGVRQFLARSNCQLELPESYQPTPRREGDTTLIDLAIAERYNDQQLISIQRVRYFLQVTYVSDVYNAAGDDVLNEVKRHQLIKCSAPNSLYPRQPKPPKKDWTTLLDLLRGANVRLGPWLPTWQNYRKWNQVFSPSQGYCWVRDKSWTCYLNPTTPKRRYHVLDTTNSVKESTLDAPDAVPIDLWHHQSKLHVNIPRGRDEPPPKPTDRSASFIEYLREGPEWEKQMFANVRSHETPERSVMSAMAAKQQLTIYVHGTCEQEKGAFGWSFHVEGNLIWEGSGSARGEPMSNSRAHAYGYLASVMFLAKTIEFYGAYAAPRTTVKLFSDSKSWQARKTWFFERIVDRPREYSYPDHDVTLQIETVMNDLKPQIRLLDLLVPSYKPSKAKKGSPAQTPTIHRATQLASLQLDQLAPYHEPLRLIPLQSCKVYLLHDEKYISGDEYRALKEALPQQQLKRYMMERHAWCQQTFESVNFKAYAAARRSNRRIERFTTRLAHGWLPTRKRKHAMNSAANDKCFWCHQTETQDHIFQCPHQSAWQDEFLERLANHLEDSTTDPTVKQEVLGCVESWLYQPPCPCKCDQQGIGNHLLIRGYVAIEWTKLQDRYYKFADVPFKRSITGEAWTKKLILYLWDEAFQLWDKRNKEIFESDDSSTLLFDLKQQVTELYALEDKVLARDRYNFDTPLNDRLNHTPFQLHNFVKIQGPIIRQSFKEAETLAAANTQPLTELFPQH
jgi:hypothetical protein